MTRKHISPAAAAEIIGVSVPQVRKLAAKGVLKGRPPTDWQIDSDSARAYAERERKPGRPRKETTRAERDA